MVEREEKRHALVVVAHPDDETIWAGGTILMHPDWNWHIISLCRGDDPDRRPRFEEALRRLGARGAMASLDDGPEQQSLDAFTITSSLTGLIESTGCNRFDILLGHSPFGEYTRHRRHEEVSMALCQLWASGRLSAGELWLFAYDDSHGLETPAPIRGATMTMLEPEIYDAKHAIIENVYGFSKGSFESKAAGGVEAFWKFSDTRALHKWLFERIALHENSGAL